MKTDYVSFSTLARVPLARGAVDSHPAEKVSGKMYIGAAASNDKTLFVCNIRRGGGAGKSRKPQACVGVIMIMLMDFSAHWRRRD